MFHDLCVSDWMVGSVPVVTPITSVQAALRLARDHGLSDLPVCDKGSFVGLIGEKDMLALTPSMATSLSRFEISELLEKVTVKTAMKPATATVGPETSLRDAAEEMVRKSVEVLPVIDGGRFVGMIRWVEVLGAAIGGCPP